MQQPPLPSSKLALSDDQLCLDEISLLFNNTLRPLDGCTSISLALAPRYPSSPLSRHTSLHEMYIQFLYTRRKCIHTSCISRPTPPACPFSDLLSVILIFRQRLAVYVRTWRPASMFAPGNERSEAANIPPFYEREANERRGMSSNEEEIALPE